MATAAYCSECNGYVWVSAEGACNNGHPRSCLRDVHAAAELPTPVGVAPVPQAPARPGDPPPDAAPPFPVPPAGASAPAPAPAQDPSCADATYPQGGFPAQGDPLSGAVADPAGYYMPPRAPVNASNTNNIWVRVAAYLIDFVIVVVAQGVFGLLAGFAMAFSVAMSGGNPETAADSPAVTIILYLVGATIFLGYFIIAEAAFGATVGKKAFGLRVVNAEGEAITWGQSIGRNLMRLIDLLFWGAVGVISMSSSALRQRLGDRVAKTYVIR